MSHSIWDYARMQAILTHYSEIGLKGKNRSDFVRALVENIRMALAPLGKVKVEHSGGGLVAYPGRDAPSTAVGRLAKIPGIATIMPVYESAPEIAQLKERLGEAIGGRTFSSFALDTRRADKSFPLTSQDISREVGEWLRQKSGARVDLTKPELTVFIEVTNKKIFFGFEKTKGIGGLPVGASGKVISMLSGGIDSPVASQMLMKRGCRVVFVHFHSYPYLSKTSQEKVAQLVKILDEYQQGSRLYLVPFGDLQKQLLLSVPARYLVVLYRRFMFRIAGAIAQKEKARALATGESVGQVASQTLDNIAVIGSVASLPLLRPLAGMNKEEIIAKARALGTYDISIIPDQDCCQLFVPKHPATAANIRAVEKIEVGLKVNGLVAEALKAVQVKEA